MRYLPYLTKFNFSAILLLSQLTKSKTTSKSISESTPMITKKLLRSAKMKDGRIFNAGEEFQINFLPEFSPTFSGYEAKRVSDGQSFKTKHFGLFFTPPTTRTLEKWVSDGVAKSVTGRKTECDGHGDDGSPSWLLALGLI
jgi:hypothetical protein